METPTCLKIGQSTETFHFEMRENFMPRFVEHKARPVRLQ